MKHDAPNTVVQALPSVSVIGATIMGLSLPDWAAIVGIGFILLQAAYFIWRWIREAKK
jgi:hypothetical protein